MQNEETTEVLVYGGTAPALVAAVRLAREGRRVILVTPTSYLGGSLPSLGAVETHYRGNRAPLLQEFIDRIAAHYRQTYGEDSEQLKVCLGGMMVKFEPHVAEEILHNWVMEEPLIQWVKEHRPIEIERLGRRAMAVLFTDDTSGRMVRITAAAMVEGSYEGDLMSLAGATWRIGREARAEFAEPRAGRVFTQWLNGLYPRAAAEGRLNLVTAGSTTSDPLPGSTGEGDDNIQSYSYRLCLTDDPENRRLLDSPPLGYDRSVYAPILLTPEEKEKLPLPFHHRFLIYSLRETAERDHLFHGHALPNRKRSWNATNFTGAGKGYAEATPALRREIERRHLDHALGLMWFLQHDPEVPADLRTRACTWGLARDEFVDNHNLPRQLYIREARRMVGRSIFTEHDALLAPGWERAPVHADSIGITEFSLDSLACTTERLPGTLCDGQLFQMEVSRPGQVPWGVLVPRELDNVLVVTTVSATHVGWGTIRQTPTLMHLAESAAWALILAAREGVAPAEVNIDRLQRLLVENGVMITFFNDVDMSTREPWARDAQLAGCRGVYRSYDWSAPELRTHDPSGPGGV